MAPRKKSRPAALPESGIVLHCFDRDLQVRRELFADAVEVFTAESEVPPEILPGHPATLQFENTDCDLSAVIDWLTPRAAEASTWYLHHHDNLVIELAVFQPYQRSSFVRRLRLFRTRPAAEGGANLLGVVDRSTSWILVLDNSNQGEFRIDFFGPADWCAELKSVLAAH